MGTKWVPRAAPELRIDPQRARDHFWVDSGVPGTRNDQDMSENPKFRTPSYPTSYPKSKNGHEKGPQGTPGTEN